MALNQVFSMLDTKSLMQVAACCTMFNEYAMNPLCYSHMDLTTAFESVDDGVLSTMIHRAGIAGKELRSLKLGSVCDQDEVIPFLTSSCLAPLSSKRHQLDGNLLRSLHLHLYNLEWMDHNYLCDALSACCSNLIDLKIVGMTGSVEMELDALTRKCRLIEHLFLQYCCGDGITDSTIRAFATNCPNLSSLTLIGFPVNDAIVRSLVQGFLKLKYMKISSSRIINGSFLRDLGSSCKDSPLETLILRNCRYLMENEVLQFLNSLIAGDFRFIRYIDVSNYKGLACDENGNSRTSVPRFPLKKLKKERSYVKFMADFPSGLPRYFNYKNCR